MSKILIVEPHKMLRHAFAVALSPEHEIETAKVFPPSEALKGADVAIVDAASLRESGSAPDPSAAQSSRVPIIWIDDYPAGAGENVFSLKPPVEREALKRAVAQCAQRFDKSEPAARPKGRAASAPRTKSQEKSSQPAAEDERKFIELVDVVE